MFQYHFEHSVDAEVTKAVIIRRNHPIAIIFKGCYKVYASSFRTAPLAAPPPEISSQP